MSDRIVQLTLPEKEKPYTQHDMDVMLGLPINLNMGGAGLDRYTIRGRIQNAAINPDGSATVTVLGTVTLTE